MAPPIDHQAPANRRAGARLPARVLRLLRHASLDATDLRRHLDDAALDRLTAQVRDSETRHRGEIRLCLEASLPPAVAWAGTDARERALDLFSQLRVWDTEDNSGVLIYLLLAEHRIELVADRGLTRHVAPERWQAIVAGMQAALAAGRYEAALQQAVAEVSALLEQHFPLQGGQANPNELPDRPLLR